jgi:drug/metabolite transporter (DMT)-like permease
MIAGMKSERMLIGAGFALISLIWGSTWLAIKIGLESTPPIYGVAIRFTLAALIIFGIMQARGERIPFDRSSVSLYLTVGTISFSIPFALVYWGEQYISSGLASVLFAINPFVVAIGSRLLLPGERMSFYKLAGVCLGFLGILIIFWADVQIDNAGLWAMVAVLVSTLLQGISLVIVKRQQSRVKPMALTLGGMLFGICILYAGALIFEDASRIRFDGKGVGSILYLGTFGSVLTFVTYYWLLKRVEAVYLSLVAFVTPVLAVILGAIWLHEQLSPRMFSGTALVLLGILVTNGKDLAAVLQGRNRKSTMPNTSQ